MNNLSNNEKKQLYDRIKKHSSEHCCSQETESITKWFTTYFTPADIQMASTQARLLFFDNSVANASLLVNETTLKQLLRSSKRFFVLRLAIYFHKNDTQVLDGAHANANKLFADKRWQS